MTITVKINGIQELTARMRGMSQEMNLKTARAATGAGAQVIKKLAIANVIASPSVDEGDLKDNIIAKRIPPRDSPYTSEHIVTVRRGKKGSKSGKRGAPHAWFVEHGTVNMPAEPYMRPAFDKGKGAAAEAITKTIQRRLKKAKL